MTHLIPFPRPALRHITLLQLDGRPWATAGFTGPSDAWGWVAETVAHEHAVSEDDVGCIEDPDGAGLDLVTVEGMPVYRIFHGLTSNIC
jgi:hypothetical protein